VEAKLESVSPEVPSFHLVGTDIILGRDAALSAVHLDDPSVSGLHSRLTRLANGDYLIRDQDSIAGTWVNYTPVPDHGTVLHHGDLIHVGRIEYRFVLAHPPRAKEIRVSPLNNEPGLARESDPESTMADSQ
jgi:pSer/pThr/pTyr-binding forkhead associated (FHA) protein